MRIANELNMRPRFRRGCLAGVSYCIVSPVGDVQPCAYMDKPIGNVREVPFSELWRDSPVFKELRTLEYEGKCGECRYKKSCGGCRARAAFYNDGDYMSSDEICLHSTNEKVKVING
ncbi:pyrroloquinoline quinone biosynthesis protein PqqE [compost metagenome]